MWGATPPNSDPGHGIDVELGGAGAGALAANANATASRRRTYSTTEPPKMEAVGSNGNPPSSATLYTLLSLT